MFNGLKINNTFHFHRMFFFEGQKEQTKLKRQWEADGPKRLF